MGRDTVVSVRDSQRARWSGGRIRVGGEIFRIRPDGPWGIPTILYNGYRVSFQGVNGQGMSLTTDPTLRRGYSFVACSRVKFTILLLFLHYLKT